MKILKNMKRKIDFKTLSCKYFANCEGINQYLNDIRKYTKMTPEEEEALFARYHNGDKSARQEIFLRNQRFVYSLAKRYAKTDDEVLDYVGEGNLGLNEAIDKYEPNKGFKFMTYAVWYIRRSMNYYLTDTKNMINRTNNLKIAKKIDTFKQKFFTENGRQPDENEIIEHLEKEHNVSIKNISDVYDVSIASINETASSDDKDYTVESESAFTEKTSIDNDCERVFEKEHAKAVVMKLMKSISVSEMKVLAMRFGLNGNGEMTAEAIAEEMGMSLNSVNAMVDNATKKMKQYAFSKKIMA